MSVFAAAPALRIGPEAENAPRAKPLGPQENAAAPRSAKEFQSSSSRGGGATRRVLGDISNRGQGGAGAKAAGGAARSALDGAASGLKKDSGPLKSSRGADAPARAPANRSSVEARGGDAAARAVVRAPSPEPPTPERPAGRLGCEEDELLRQRGDDDLFASPAQAAGGEDAWLAAIAANELAGDGDAAETLAACERSCSQALSLGALLEMDGAAPGGAEIGDSLFGASLGDGGLPAIDMGSVDDFLAQSDDEADDS